MADAAPKKGRKEKRARSRYGDGHIRERSPGHHQITIAGPKGEDGKRGQIIKTVIGSHQDAVREKRLMQSEVEKGTYVKATKLTVAEFLDEYHTRYVAVKRKPQGVQAIRYEIDGKIKPVLGSVALSSLTARQVEDFRDGLVAAGLKASSVNNLLGLLRHALKWGVKQEVVGVNVADRVENLPNRQRKKRGDYSLENFKRLEEVFVGTPLELAVTTALHTGVRIGEALGLWLDDIDLEAGTITVRRGLCFASKRGHYWSTTKTESSDRVFGMTTKLRSALQERLRDLEDELGPERLKELLAEAHRREDGAGSDHYFFDPKYVPEQVCALADDHRLLGLNAFDKRFRTLVTQAGMAGVTFHDLRHHFATALHHLGVQKATTSQLMGHSNSRITEEVYTHVLPEDMDRAIEKLDEYLR